MSRVTVVLGLAVTAAMVGLTAFPPPILDRARDAVFDGYQRSAPRPYDPTAPVHIIDIDETALEVYGQWPWPRSYMAEMTDRLFDHGAAAIGFDVLFPEPDRTSPELIVESWARFSDGPVPGLADLGADVDFTPHDTRFAQAMEGRSVVLSVAGGLEGTMPEAVAGFAVTGATPTTLTTYPGAIGNLPELTAAASGIGTISLGRNADGITRTVPMVSDFGGVLIPSLSAELLRVAQGAGGHVLRTTQASGEVSGGTVAATAMQVGGLAFPLEADGRFRLYFAGYQPQRVTPVGDLLEADGIDPALQQRLAGRIILVGSSAQGLFDIRTTPLDGQIAGVTLHAEIIEQIVAGAFLSRPDWMRGLEILIVALAGIALTILNRLERPVLGLSAALSVSGGSVLGGILAFTQMGVLFNPLMAVLTSVLVYIPGTTLGYLAKERARRSIRERFARFLPPDLIAEIEKNPTAALTPEGAERDLTVMFVDMRGFSTVTEGMSPDRVVTLVNTFLSAVAETLVDHGATIDKFMGDAVMAFWNAPIERSDHAAAALGALHAVNDAAEQANFMLTSQGLPRVNLGVGLNTGPASVGLMGSRDRLSYTCIGDSVTLAARLEGLTRIYGTRNCVGPNAVAECPPHLQAVTLDLIAVKGFARAVEVATVLPRMTPGLEGFADALAKARATYIARDWTGAEAAFLNVAKIKVPTCNTGLLAQLYLDRIAAHKEDPPPEGWAGEYVALSKR
ncbi:adenylate/guanylate cyclase domain-containing protein [Rhodobacteraceae bacterium N5(2021)]|uniref:Adenylate/guanylate cyclase domain-containing protein n=1 Tax=Gymnodinialimonas phycosphaerae TaxID=2841589 RepID=A0A975YGE5_9RHOB|nr:adenylate/guanylate cyclase domain-containing protein [Gymnodinialimonas phycosphaerae]MBY4891493.1 adenylate/guanylate cyclase domain-containing protein [Gymnodinialimonas phycosphaerae]